MLMAAAPILALTMTWTHNASSRSDSYLGELVSIDGLGVVHGISNGTARYFLSIPYGTVAKRFAAAQAAPAWHPRELDATAFGPMCVQTPVWYMPEFPQSEDCLSLNVFTPPESQLVASGELLPVMVWIHGGGNLNGAARSPNFSGAHLVQLGVVLVSINYLSLIHI